MPASPIYLASASPRRSELLRQIGVAHLVRVAPVDETAHPDESPVDYVRRLALAKAEAGWQAFAAGEDRPLLAADTTVALGAEVIGKPADRFEAIAMLTRLSGREHEVHTAVALRHAGGTGVAISSSRVSFRELHAGEAERYWASGEPADKAGAYAIQGFGAVFVRRLEGSYSGVMGLPLYETWELLVPVLGLNGTAPR
jgi:septum formation protein